MPFRSYLQLINTFFWVFFFYHEEKDTYLPNTINYALKPIKYGFEIKGITLPYTFTVQQGLEIRCFWYQKKTVQCKTVLREVYTYVLNDIFFLKKQCIFKAFVQKPCFMRLHLCTKGDFFCPFSSPSIFKGEIRIGRSKIGKAVLKQKKDVLKQKKDILKQERTS